MSDEFKVLFFIGVCILIVVLYFMQQNQKRKREQTRTRYAKPARSRPASKPAARTRRPATSSMVSGSLSKKIKVDGSITSNQATLVASYFSSRDEFLGTIEVLASHHTGEAACNRQKRTAPVIKSWQFLGSGDRYDARKRSADFKRLAEDFQDETLTIVAEYEAQGWRVEPVTIDTSNDIYHLSR
ncbi:hypothetical protein ACFLYO_07415 [Chloroflexota bacterium]